jgi:hypothetical protein
MPWWQRVPGIGRATAAAKAGVFVSRLVDEGLNDAEVVARLRTVRGDRQALQDVARVMAQRVNSGYPSSRIYRLLRAAADDPVPALTDAETAVESRQQQLWNQPFDVSFRQLAEQVPELRKLERSVRTDPGSFLRGLTFRDTGRIGGPPSRADRQDGQMLILRALQKAIRRLVGPRSGLADPVLASAAAERAVWHYLREASGIDPRTWRTR